MPFFSFLGIFQFARPKRFAFKVAKLDQWSMGKMGKLLTLIWKAVKCAAYFRCQSHTHTYAHGNLKILKSIDWTECQYDEVSDWMNGKQSEEMLWFHRHFRIKLIQFTEWFQLKNYYAFDLWHTHRVHHVIESRWESVEYLLVTLLDPVERTSL